MPKGIGYPNGKHPMSPKEMAKKKKAMMGVEKKIKGKIVKSVKRK